MTTLRSLVGGLLLAIVLAAPARAQDFVPLPDDHALYGAAFALAEAGEWDRAYTMTAKGNHPALVKVITWIRLTKSQPVPPFEEITAFAEWGRELQVEVVKRMDRRACPVAWVAFFVDAEGAWMLATPKSGQTLCNMRTGMGTILSTLPKEQRQSVEDTLRPLDELDADRLAAWKTVDDLRPKLRPPSAVDETDIVNLKLGQRTEVRRSRARRRSAAPGPHPGRVDGAA